MVEATTSICGVAHYHYYHLYEDASFSYMCFGLRIQIHRQGEDVLLRNCIVFGMHPSIHVPCTTQHLFNNNNKSHTNTHRTQLHTYILHHMSV